MFGNIPLADRPPHVPPGRVRDFDIYDVNITDGDWQLHLRNMLHAEGVPALFWTPRNTGHWVAARASTAREVLTNTENFTSRKIVVIQEMNPNPPYIPLQVDPPDHRLYRDLLAPALAPGALKALHDRMTSLAVELIEGFKPRGECEFMGDFATAVPITIFMQMAGLPEEDRPRLLRIANSLVRQQVEGEQPRAYAELCAYVTRLIQVRRENPGTDLISRLTQAKVNEQPLDDSKLMGMVTLLMSAGLDTVVAMMGFFIRYLAQHQELRRELVAHPERIKPAVEELLRRHPIANLAREVRRDCSLDEVSLQAGDMVLVPTAAYGLDDRQYENPEVVDLDRRNKIHQTFGDGPHRCMGSMLARLELEVLLTEWLKRIPEYSVKPGVPIQTVSTTVAAFQALPLVWNRPV